MQAEMPAARLGIAQAVDEVDIGALGRALWRRKRWIVGLTLAAASLAFAAAKLVTPLYKSEARVLIEARENIFLRPEAEKLTERSAVVDPEAVTSQVQLVLSRDLAGEVIRKLKLGERGEFDPVLRGLSRLKLYLVHLGLVKDPMEETPEERVLKSYFDRLVAYSVERSRVIAIEFQSENSDLAAQAANAVAEGYLVLQQAAKQDQSRAASQWLAGEIETLRKKVAEAESKVEQYRASTNLFVGTNNTTLSNQQLGDVNAQLSAARAQKADAEAKARIIRESLRSGGPVEFSDIVNSELMRRLSEQRVTLQAQLAEQSSTLLDQHPRIKELRAQIADLERQLRLEADRLARSLENDSKLADARVASLVASLEQLKRSAASTNEQDVELRALDRDAKSQRDLLESYLAKYREASARDNIGAASPEARIISRAVVSTTPAYPKTLATVLVAALGTLVLSVGCIVTGELLGAASGVPAPAPARREPVTPPAESLAKKAAPANAEAAADAAVPGVLPPLVAIESKPMPNPSAAGGIPHDAIASFARELQASGRQGSRIVLLGAQRQMPVARVAIALARKLAEKARVVVTDLMFEPPGLSAIAVDRDAPGIGDLVAGSASFGQIITRDRYSAAHLVMAGAAARPAHAILNSRQFSLAIEALAHSYDHLVINAGSLGDLPLELLAPLAPRAALVADESGNALTVSTQERLGAAGFRDVTVLPGAPAGSDTPLTGSRAAA